MNNDWNSYADDDSNDRTRAADNQRLNQELVEDFMARRPDGFADADLPRSLRYGDHHDVHDPYAADKQRNETDHYEHHRQRQPKLPHRIQNRDEVLHVIAGRGR